MKIIKFTTKKYNKGFDNKLLVGTWIAMLYGFWIQEFVIIKRIKNKILLAHRGWLVSDALWFSLEELKHEEHLKILGKGKYRWWRIVIPSFINNLICPFSRYKNNHEN